MLNLKQTAVAVLALGSSAVFAGTMGPVCTPGSVTVPCEMTAWDFGGQALYLQHVGGLGNGYDFSTTVGNVTNYNNEFSDEWDWGFKIEGSYHFSTGNDLTVNWYHLDNNNTYTTALLLTDPFLGSTFNTLTTNPEWDQVNVEFGQHVDFGEFKKIRFHGGVNYSRLEQSITTSLNNTLVRSQFNTKYNGFGPRVGMDMSYHLGNGFAMYANGATSILIGDTKFNNAFPNSPLTGISNGSREALVPELEAKLGVMYNYPMAQGNLGLDVGYMWVDYIDVRQTAFTGGGNNTLGTNRGLDGVYFGLKYVGNV